MTELRTENFNEDTVFYAEYEYNGTNYAISSTVNGNNESFYLYQKTGNIFTKFSNTSVFTLDNYEQNAIVRLDLTIKNDTVYVFYATYDTQADKMQVYVKVGSLDSNTKWTDYTDNTLNSELVPDLEFGYDPYVADNGYIYVSYAITEYPRSYKLRYYNGTEWSYVVNQTVNANNEDITNIVGSIYNGNTYIAYSYVDTNTEQYSVVVKQANNGKWDIVSTPENINDNTVVDLAFDYKDDGLYLNYSVATITEHNTKITSKNYN